MLLSSVCRPLSVRLSLAPLSVCWLSSVLVDFDVPSQCPDAASVSRWPVTEWSAALGEQVRSQLRTRSTQLIETRQAGEQRITERQQRLQRAKQAFAQLRTAEEDGSRVAAQQIQQHTIDTASHTQRIQAAEDDICRVEQAVADSNRQKQHNADMWQRRREAAQAKLQHAQVQTATQHVPRCTGWEGGVTLHLPSASAHCVCLSCVVLLLR